MFKPMEQSDIKLQEVDIDEEKATYALTQMIRCKTVSRYDPKLIDENEFDKFRALLPQIYPNIFKTCAYERIEKTGILFTW